MTALQALIGFAAWTLCLVAGVFLYRGLKFVTGTPINSWPRGAKPSSDVPLVKRLEDAHANCLENLPVFAVLVLGAIALGRQDSIAALAPWMLYARVGQSLTHLTGVGRPHVICARYILERATGTDALDGVCVAALTGVTLHAGAPMWGAQHKRC